MSTAKITCKRIDKNNLCKSSVKLVIELKTKAGAEKTNNKLEVYKTQEAMQKSSEAKRSKQQT